jgi:hypothetical protein
VWHPGEHTGSWRAVWAYSAKRAARDTTTLTLQENRAKEVVAGQRTARTPRFVKTTHGARSFDEAALTRARRLVGLKGYVTNIPVTLTPATEVIASYHDLWHVEQSFRMSKTDLRARPMFLSALLNLAELAPQEDRTHEADSGDANHVEGQGRGHVP